MARGWNASLSKTFRRVHGNAKPIVSRPAVSVLSTRGTTHIVVMNNAQSMGVGRQKRA
jgi:hypothetical protein